MRSRVLIRIIRIWMVFSFWTLGNFSQVAWASQPGEPFDCNDWVILEPGLACADYNPFPSSTGYREGGSPTPVIDNAGHLYTVEDSIPVGFCRVNPIYRTQIVRLDGATRTVIAYIDGRCYENAQSDDQRVYPVHSLNSYANPLIFDPTAGILLLPLFQRFCNSCDADSRWVPAITGFATLFEVIQTYSPAASALTFHVPANPEALPAANHFDTYWGRISDLPDIAKAQPMACGYPASPPAVGDFLTVADTSPIPPVGQANYIVTAVTHGVDRRYGRQLTGPTMTGRDPGLLPACIQP